MHSCHHCSDPYVKMSFRGPIDTFPYFTTLHDPVQDYYKTKTIPKVLHFNFIIFIVYECMSSVDIKSKVEF